MSSWLTNSFRLHEEVFSSHLIKADNPKLLEYARKHFIKPPTQKSYNFSIQAMGPTYFTASKTLTWKFINNHIQKIFNKTNKGFFVEAGALDGILLSNTVWLEMYKNWTGLLIEPHPANYKLLVQKNRNVWTSNACLSTSPYPKETLLVAVSNDLVSQGRIKMWLTRGPICENSLANRNFLQKFTNFLSRGRDEC